MNGSFAEMKCRKCGNEVDIGEVYCQKCGTAIQIVPEYSPLEDEIDSVLEQTAIPEGDTARIFFPSKEEKTEQMQGREKEQKRKKRIRTIGILVFASAVILFFAGGISYIRYQEIHSYEYQYALGLKYMEQQNYDAALASFSEALEYQSDSIEIRIYASDIYMILKNYSRAVELLLEVVNVDPRPEYYKKLMKACELAGNSELMNKILRENRGNEIGRALADYQVEKVTVNISGGKYEDYLVLFLSTEQKNRTIYYTLDGTEPTESSSVYTDGIELKEMGTFVLRAIAYNESHIAGEELRETYIIEFTAPNPPDVVPSSGSYLYGEQISMEVPEGATGYFTIDGTVPDREHAYVYTDPIFMPVGSTIFSAIVVDKHGMISSVTKKSYFCGIDRPFGYDAAVIKLKNYLVEIGMMSDLRGNRGSGEKISVEFNSLEMIEGTECYVFKLRRTSENKTSTLEDKIYAITTETGEIFPLIQIDGKYQFVRPEPLETESEAETETESEEHTDGEWMTDLEVETQGEVPAEEVQIESDIEVQQDMGGTAQNKPDSSE